MKVSDVMTRQVISIAPEATILEAIRSMLQNHISGLPVVGADGTLLGIVTEGDFLRRAETDTDRKRARWIEFLMGPGKLANEYIHTHGRTVDEVMTRDPVTVDEDTSLEEVVQLMESRQIKRVPVVSNGKVIGIVSRANLLHVLASCCAMQSPAKNDAAIRDQILAEIEKQIWAPNHLVNVLVHDGVVELWGTILDGHQGRALKVIAENVPGVRGIQDHLVWVEPISGMVISDPGGDTPLAMPPRAK